jgi:ubiquinone/menaquinone biosynthesis C-methylase UbiE
LTALCLFLLLAGLQPALQVENPGYSWGAASPGGTGKFYLGREIAEVMGHQGASWLERAERESEEAPAQLIAELGLEPGQTVADVGAGTGYFTRRLARAVGPAGKVLAVDIQPEMLEYLRAELEARALTNVQTVLGDETDPGLPPSSLDLVLMVDVYHEFSYPYEMVQGILRALRPGGRLVYVEYRAEDPQVSIKRLHKMTEAQVRREASVHALDWDRTIDKLPRQHIVIFKKPGGNASAR